MLDNIHEMSELEFQNFLIVIQLNIMDHVMKQKIKEGKTVFSGTTTLTLN